MVAKLDITPSAMLRRLKRLHLLGRIKKVTHTYRCYLTPKLSHAPPQAGESVPLRPETCRLKINHSRSQARSRIQSSNRLAGMGRANR